MHRLPIAALCLSLIAGTLLLTGCGPNHTHVDSKNAAEARWLNVRSAMIIQEANGRFESGDLEEAERSLREAIQLDPTNPHLYSLLGRIAIERGTLESANNHLRAATDLDPDFAEGYYFRGIVQQRWQRTQEAYECYARAAELRPENVGYLLASAEMLIAMGREDEALTLLQGKAKQFEGNASIRVAIAQIYRMKRDFANAIHYYRQAMALQSDDTLTLEQFAGLLVDAGDFDQAITHLQRLTILPDTRDRRDLKILLARAYQGAGRVHDARQVYVALTNADPQDVDAWLSLGDIAWRTNDLNGTLYAANRIIALAPLRQEGHMMAGLVWHQREDVNRALRHFDRAAELAPNDPTPMIMRGIVLEEAKRPQAAAQAYREALKRQPDDRRATRLLERIAGADTP